jgi:hypothetical protein
MYFVMEMILSSLQHVPVLSVVGGVFRVEARLGEVNSKITAERVVNNLKCALP